MSTTRSSKPIMFSYQWNCQKLVDRIHQHLEEHYQIEIWMDTKGGMKDSLTNGMAEGVQNCSILIPFLTPEYQQSANCKKELTYAMQLKKIILPVLIGNDDDPQWKPSDWLGLTMADVLYLNFKNIDDDNFQSKCEELINKIDQHFPTESQSRPSSPQLDDEDQNADEQ